MNGPLLLSSSSYCWAQRRMTWDMVSLGQLPMLRSLPISCPPAAHWPWGDLQRQPRGCASTVQQQPEHWVLSTLCSQNPKVRTTWAAVRKVHSIPDRPSTPGQDIPLDTFCWNYTELLRSCPLHTHTQQPHGSSPWTHLCRKDIHTILEGPITPLLGVQKKNLAYFKIPCYYEVCYT